MEKPTRTSNQSIKNILQFTDFSVACRALDSLSIPSGDCQIKNKFANHKIMRGGNDSDKRHSQAGYLSLFKILLLFASASYPKSDYALNVPSLNFMLGNGFAMDGNHGGLNTEINLEVPIGNWGLGFDLSEISEHEPFMGIAKTDPLEDYHNMGIEFERRFVSGIFVFSSGFGASYLTGTSRTAFRYSDIQCSGFAWFGDCPESEQVTVGHYDSRKFETFSFDPFIRVDVQIFQYLGIGFNLQSLVNKHQGLGSASFMVYFGNKTAGKKSNSMPY